MAYQLARDLARRDLLGGDPAKATLRWRLGVYSRQVGLRLRRRESDPWDAGLLVKSEDDNGFEHFCARLAQWRPRKPTILLLDDPHVDWSHRVWRALTSADAARSFAHPVCLLVANQTVPPDTGLVYSTETRDWTYEAQPADPPPILLPKEAWFTPEETREAALKSHYLIGKSFDVEKEVREILYEITDGNPLLVQLAVEQLGSVGSIKTMTAEALPQERAKRIIGGLEHRGVKDEGQLAALALATLVGGASRDRIETAIKAIFANPAPLPPIADLQACFPTEPLGVGGATRIPAVRPDIVGDAFVDCVLRTIGADRATALAEAAFRLEAATMLRSVRRARPRSSPMTAALNAVDPTRIVGLDPVQFALAYADVATICQPADRPLSTTDSRTEALHRAIEVIDRLTVEQRLAFCRAFAELCEIPADQRGVRQIRATTAMALMDAAAAGEGVVAPPECWIRLFKSLKAEGTLSAVDGVVRSARAIASLTAADEFTIASWKMGWQWREAIAPAWRALAQTFEVRGLSAPSSRFAAMSAISRPNEARAAADVAAAIAARFADDPSIQCEAAQARSYEAYAWCQVPAGARAMAARGAADITAAIAARFADDPAIQREAAEARRREASAWCQVPAGAQATAARGAADITAAIAARFADDPAIQREAAEARRREAYAWCQVPAGAQATAARGAADITAAIAARFVDDPAIQREAADARRCEAYAWCQVPAGAQATAARAAADITATIAARFADDPAIQREAAYARSCEAYAWSEVPAGAQATAARAAADITAAIAAPFADDPAIQRAAAHARRSEAYAWSEVPAGAQATAARAAADITAAIAARFADDPAIQRAAAEARNWADHARRQAQPRDGV